MLTCGDAGTQCVVWRAEPGADQLSTWQVTKLPAAFSASGLKIDPSELPQVCVFGRGMVCGRDRWQEVLPGSGPPLHAIALGRHLSLAAGEHGQWWKREAGGAWQPQAALDDLSLDQVSVAADSGVVVGGGKLQAVVGSANLQQDCAAPADLAAVMLDPGFVGLGYAVTRSGLILLHAATSPQRAQRYCAYQQLTLRGPILDSDAAPCSASHNPRALTEAALFGTQLCVSVP